MQTTSSIRTPDQRLRVFVSSTLRELEPERAAAQKAISALRMTPVLFELGARPHPPRDLYQAYVEQSDIFIGIYWEQYGWIAPEMEISGLEDEYHLARRTPKLVYIKEPASARDSELERFLNQIRAQGAASYQRFSSPDELCELIQNDLALLFSEGFSLPQPVQHECEQGFDHRTRRTVPPQRSALIGREDERAAIGKMILQDGVRLLTLTGPGGVGKTSLAIRAAHDLAPKFVDGIFYVELDAIEDPALVIPAIAEALGLPESARGSRIDHLLEYIDGRSLLLVLDNLEQVIEAANEVGHLLDCSDRLRVIATSRKPLHLLGEQEFPVLPLRLPSPGSTSAAILDNPAVRLFIERATRIRPGFAVSDANVGDVLKICLLLEGLPLAIELAAARVRLLQPAALLARLDQALPSLTHPGRDIPERQRTMRAAIQWSYQLLSIREQTAFQRLAVFHGDWSLEAAEAVIGTDPIAPDMVIDLLASLVEQSLVIESDSGSQVAPRYRFLVPVRKFAQDLFDVSADVEVVRARHSEYYRGFAEEAEMQIRGTQQVEWLDQLERDRENFRAAAEWLLGSEQPGDAVRIARSLTMFWVMRGGHSEGRTWILRALEQVHLLSDEDRIDAWSTLSNCEYGLGNSERVAAAAMEGVELARAIGDRYREAFCLGMAGFGHLQLSEFEEAEHQLTTSVSIAREIGENWGTPLLLGHLALIYLCQGDPQRALDQIQESLAFSRKTGDRLARYTLHFIGARASASLGDQVAAWHLFSESLRATAELRDETAFAYCLQGIGRVTQVLGDSTRAACLFGAAERLLDGMVPPHWAFIPAAEEQEAAIVAARDALGSQLFDASWQTGYRMRFEEMLAFACEGDPSEGEVPSVASNGNTVPNPGQLRGLAERLTPRELDVLRLLAAGRSTEEISGELFITRETARTHIRNILSKLDVPSRAAAVAHAFQQGLVER